MKLFKRILLILSTLFLALSCSDDDEPEKFILVVAITPEDGGSVSPNGGTFDEGTVVTLTGTPSEAYVFKEWAGDLSSTENPVSLSMDSDMNVTLVFVKSDRDNDGVADDLDNCPNTPAGEAVDENGCSSSQIDTDGDGVSDEEDFCENTPEGAVVDEQGCSDSQKDTDADGVTDDLDVCPNTPAGENADEDGCSDSQKDSDGDGVTDDNDLCENTPEGEDVNEQGCPTTPPIYLDVNGVTVKAYEWSQPGQTGIINGVVYTIVDEAMLRALVENGADLTRVCTTKVTNMRRLFFQKFSFNQDISSWDVSNVTDMYQMFSGDIMSGLHNSFNQDISSWNVSNVSNMKWMFHASSFNKPIGKWDVKNVIDMEGMFSVSAFNQDISSWNVSKVTNMSGMFVWTPFNQPIGDWDVSSVTDMSEMFVITPFNQPIGNWDVSNVTDMSSMFMGSLALGAPNPFDQDISNWDVSNVQNMRQMFKESRLNQDLSSWNVTGVIDCVEFSLNTPQWTLPKPNFTNCDPD